MSDEERSKQLIEHAQQVANSLIEKASSTARELVDKTNERNTQSLIDALKDVFGEGEKSNRFIDVTRIPLICKSIVETARVIDEMSKSITAMHEDMALIKVSVNLMQRVIYGGIATILLSVLGAFLTVVLKK